MRSLTREEARRIAIRAQLLDAERPSGLLPVISHLTFLQLDPTAAIAPSADLIAWSRIGNAYEPAHLQDAIERDRTVFEYRGQETDIEPPIAIARPMADLDLYLADMAAWPPPQTRQFQWLQANDGFRRRVLDQLRSTGPLPSREIADTCEVPWASSGWTHDRNVTQMLEFLVSHGEIAVSGRRGRQRLWDVAERVYPPKTRAIAPAKARRTRNEKRLRSLGVARAQMVGDAGDDVEIDGTKGLWRVDPAATAEAFVGRTALLSPFDRLIHDRVRALEVFEFEYTLEMYKPPDKRRWGYFALPVLHHDRLIGKVDAIADRKTSTLRVNEVHQDISFTRSITSAVDAELDALAQWLGFTR